MLVKCACQFEMLWWNSEQYTPTNQPLAPARIIGVERKPNYAAYDLALLLVIFFHRYVNIVLPKIKTKYLCNYKFLYNFIFCRFVQKQMGIWRSSSEDEHNLYRIYKAKSNTHVADAG